jgi:hypothetical protein
VIDEPVETAISFPLRTSAAVSAFYIIGGDPPVPQCTGSAANPTAAAGSLCVYQSLQANTLQSGDGRPKFVDPVTTTSTDTTQPFGVIVRAFAVTPADTYIYGSWAVTAP